MQVRLGQILEGAHVDTKCLGNHNGAVHKLAVEPGSSQIFYSCGEDGFVQRVCEIQITANIFLFFPSFR